MSYPNSIDVTGTNPNHPDLRIGNEQKRIVFGERLGSCLSEHSNRNIPRHCHRLTKGFDSLQLMHRPRSKIRLSTAWTRPHRNALNDKEVRPLTENSRYVLQMNLTAVAVGAGDWAIPTGFVEHH
jgi:hypothetical protein